MTQERLSAPPSATTDSAVPSPAPLRRGRLAVTAGILIVLVIGVGIALELRSLLDPGVAVAGVTEVVVRDASFAPAAIEVPVGSIVTWRWEGSQDHNVVGEGFASPNQAIGDMAHAFAEPGVFPYRCTLHYFMRGEVTVTDVAASARGLGAEMTSW